MTAAPLHSSGKEEYLQSGLRRVFESHNFPRDSYLKLNTGNPLASSPGRSLGGGGKNERPEDEAKNSPTHSLKELLISSSVDMEAATDANITALCTMDTEPVECTNCFEKFLNFSEQCDSSHKSDISLILYPIFVHIYLDLVAGGHSELAASFYDKFVATVGRPHKNEVKELAEITSSRHISTSPLATKFRSQKYSVRMSNKAFQLMMQFLQLCQVPVLLSIMQRYLAVEVYSEMSIANGDIKSDQKKPSHSATFIKPKLPQLDDNRLHVKSKSGRQGFTVAMTESHTSKSTKPIQRTSSASHVPAHLAEFKERLSKLSQLDPSTPSVALHTVTTHNHNVHCAAFSAATKQYACGFADSSLHVWSLLPGATAATSSLSSLSFNTTEGGQQLCQSTPDHSILLGHHDPIYGTCFSSNGQFLLSTSEDCTVRLWNVERKTSVVCYRGHAYPVWDAAFSPVDVYFASASYDRTARLWATDLVYPLRIFAGHTAGVDVVRFHPNGRYIATGSSDRTCRLWDIQNGQCMRLMPGSKGPITCLAFSPNGKLLVSGGDDGVVRVWELGSGRVLRECPPAVPPPPTGNTSSTSSQQITSLAFSQDGSLLASSSYGNQIKLWNVRTLSSPCHSQVTISSDSDLITQCSCPENCTVLHLQFTHKNCLHAVATVVDTGALAGGNLEPMDTTASIASATSLMQGSGGGSNAMMGTPFTAAFQQTPLLPSLQPSGIMLPFD